MSAQSVSWWSVHEYVTSITATSADYPMAGTPAWCLLADDDPAKLAAVLDAGQHHALRLEMNQEATAEAAKDIAAAYDWHSIAVEYRQLRSFREANPWAKRVIK